MGDTSIQWTDKSWNPTRGCSRVSQGCVNCYAERSALRQKESGYKGLVTITNGHPVWTGVVRAMTGKTLEAPLHWKKPARVFVNSMSDLFHEALPDEAIDRVFAVMALCPQHTFQVLTKRPERMLRWTQGIDEMDGECVRDCMIEGATQALYAKLHPGEDPSMWLAVHQPLPNVWLGTSVEDQKTAEERVRHLRQVPAAVRFISQEPQIDRIIWTPEMLRGIHWLIVGGESGPGARPFNVAWAEETIRVCKAVGIAVFVKQLGANPYLERHADGAFVPDYEYSFADRKGGNWDEWPSYLRVREYPETGAVSKVKTPRDANASGSEVR